MMSSPDSSPDPPAAASPPQATELLLAWGAGDGAALDALLPVVYAELRRQAGRMMRRESEGHTLQPTALVNEAFLRLVDQGRATWRNRAQFFGVAAQLMRRILVDHARTRQAEKRGGGVHAVTLDESDGGAASSEAGGVDVLALHDALTRLAALDPRQGRVVELRYFGGLTIEETATALDGSPATVKREWATARQGVLRARARPGRRRRRRARPDGGMLLNDTLWQKYELGKMYKVDMPDPNPAPAAPPAADSARGDSTRAGAAKPPRVPATRNVYHAPKAGDPVDATSSVDALMRLGVTFLVCNNALEQFATHTARKSGTTHEVALKELHDNLVPGAVLVPTMLIAIGRAQERGCAYLSSG
jgi:RNA polymerase sigma factor (TIGR02999 family)